MYAAEQIFQDLTYEELYYTLLSITEDDSYLYDFLEDSILEDFLYLLEIYDIIFIASDERILLTPKGEKILQYIGQFVDLNKSSVKVLKK